MIDFIHYFQARIGYAYKENEEIFEKPLITNFLAGNYEIAIRGAVLHAYERYENYLKDSYPLCFLANIKVHLMSMQPIQSDGSILPAVIHKVFEWKHDFPNSLNDHIESAIKELDPNETSINSHLKSRSS